MVRGPPPTSAVTASRRITDRYLPGTRPRLRRAECLDNSGACELKLTQKVPAGRPGYVQGLITNTYLSAAEYDLLASLPAEVLSKTRLSVPPLGIDIFDPPLSSRPSELNPSTGTDNYSLPSRYRGGRASGPADESFGRRGAGGYSDLRSECPVVAAHHFVRGAGRCRRGRNRVTGSLCASRSGSCPCVGRS